ncbi:TPA: hypothetical protein N0F65_001622 [Lagenidium giganteum]|uniref:Uncharacterized protein n=1 Tax=Lagenidium giganteum TaxID=4803 RepID=A0AAV2YKF4_9STRA|nr:TPA: hypothetical protein N0F65_001622 [Lagenidium giganteum]
MSPTAARTKQPARMSQHFAHMLAECPNDIRVYGACVADITGGVNRDACDKEFAKLRECFQRAVKKSAGKKRCHNCAAGFPNYCIIGGLGRTSMDVLASACATRCNASWMANDALGTQDEREWVVSTVCTWENDGVRAVPRDRASLEAAIAKIRETIDQLENETHEELVQGVELLLRSKEAAIAQAYANFTRRQHLAFRQYEAECQDAKRAFTTRCEELQRTMSAEMQREIQRLKAARDGVSVLDRRRTTRNLARGSANTQGYAYIDDSDASLPDSTGTSPRGRSAAVGNGAANNGVLGGAPIFVQIEHTASEQEVSTDVRRIQESLEYAFHSTARRKATKRRQRHQEKRARKLLRKSAARHGGDTSLRLRWNPALLQEGDQVVVSKAGSTDTAPREIVAQGVLTAATTNRVYVRDMEGTFVPIELREWLEGNITIELAGSQSPHMR